MAKDFMKLDKTNEERYAEQVNFYTVRGFDYDGKWITSEDVTEDDRIKAEKRAEKDERVEYYDTIHHHSTLRGIKQK